MRSLLGIYFISFCFCVISVLADCVEAAIEALLQGPAPLAPLTAAGTGDTPVRPDTRATAAAALKRIRELRVGLPD